MNKYANLFSKVDPSKSDDIKFDELIRYGQNNGWDISRIQEMRNQFDPHNTGYLSGKADISLVKNMPDDFHNLSFGKGGSAGHQSNRRDSATILLQEINPNEQARILERVNQIQYSAHGFDGGRISKELKMWLDQTFGPSWQVVILKGSHWATFSHNQHRAFHFIKHGYTHLMWCTPAAV